MVKKTRRVVRWYRRQSSDAKMPRCNASAEHLKRTYLLLPFRLPDHPSLSKSERLSECIKLVSVHSSDTHSTPQKSCPMLA